MGDGEPNKSLTSNSTLDYSSLKFEEKVCTSLAKQELLLELESVGVDVFDTKGEFLVLQ